MREDRLRAAMVRALLAGQRIRTSEVERAFRTVPRHLFLPDEPVERAYQDEAVLTKWVDGIAVSSASQPSMMAIMLEQLALRPGHRVLEIGAGTGYNAALMAEIVGPTGKVVAVDIDRDLVDGAARHLAAAGSPDVVLVTGDGAVGVPELAPYDRIVLTVGSWDIQAAWWEQLAPGGRLLLPLSIRGSQLSVALDLIDGDVRCLLSDSMRSCAFVRLRGRGADPEGSRPLADGLSVHAVDSHELDLEHLAALLAEPGAERISAVRLAAVDLWDGFGLWLSLHAPDMCRLLVSPDASGWWPSLLPPGADGGTLLLFGDRGLAMVAPTRSPEVPLDTVFPVAVRAYGPEGPEVAQRLDQLLDAWAGAGRPTATGLRLRAYPSGVTVPSGPEAVLRKAHSQLVLDWPGNPVPDGLILDG
ncbi:methyltransferase, FxLD system [Pseudonocardia spinosispora]|uniref:methyltransferase, FxLD system n=1 Tax=Pseudonocardia spinosispora TaxID=103441 RepID=UPI0004179232|nr:methyltransferase, FxLD system [Pseudonocardia spinosispora]